jgi:hypothetical protein
MLQLGILIELFFSIWVENKDILAVKVPLTSVDSIILLSKSAVSFKTNVVH